MEQFLGQISHNPLVSFTLLLLVILVLPPIFERFKLPGLIGLLFAGVILGSNGLGLLDPKTETIELLSDIGKIYLMFVAGLEIDLNEFRKSRNRSLGFGLATFAIPLIFGTTVGQIFGMSWNSSFLLGSLLASHTLLAYPIVNRLGVVSNQSVIVTIGATIFTDISALLVLAICVSINSGEFSTISLIIQLASLGIYSAVVLIGIDKVGKAYFRRTGDEQSNQFMFILLVVFLAAVGAELINIEQIVGAFLAGLAVNDVVGRSPVKEKVEFIGSTLFIPCFFVDMGLLLDIPGFIKTLTQEFPLTFAIVGSLFLSKFLAAATAKLLYRYNWDETMTMWSLSLPQVAATLAATLVGVEEGLLTTSVFNVVIVMMLLTSIAGPIITARFARKLSIPDSDLATDSFTDRSNLNSGFLYDDLAAELIRSPERRLSPEPLFRIIVPIANPQTESYLIEMAALIARHESGVIVPLSIAKAHLQMDNPSLKNTIRRSRKLLRKAVAITENLQVEAKPLVRIDDDIVHGISRTAREQNASLIVMGWSDINPLRSRLFGSIIDNVFWAAHCPVAVMRLLEQPINIQKVLVPVKDLTNQSLRTIRFARLFADANQATITLLHIRDRSSTQNEVESFERQLQDSLELIQIKTQTEIKILRHNDPAEAILATAKDFDLVVLRSMRRRTAGGLAVSDISDPVIRQLKCSFVLFGEPN
jgi:Kef-type K+ transport system membrane component KefB/nucleotide-binding universal stress UspA family protein